jgi:hypothetical protein
LLGVRVRLIAFIILVLAGVISASAAASAATPRNSHPKKKKPTLQERMRTAVAAAERSPDLWATVNVCTSAPNTDLVGIRGQMPSLGLPATLKMVVSIYYWNYTDNTFDPANVSEVVNLGTGTHGLRQGGVDFPFSPPPTGSTYLVRGTVTFQWLSGTKVVGQVTKNTGHGYANVSFSDPPGYSSGTCTLT